MRSLRALQDSQVVLQGMLKEPASNGDIQHGEPDSVEVDQLLPFPPGRLTKKDIPQVGMELVPAQESIVIGSGHRLYVSVQDHIDIVTHDLVRRSPTGYHIGNLILPAAQVDVGRSWPDIGEPDERRR